MKRSSQNLLMVILNIVLIGAVGIFAFRGGINLTGYAVAGNQSSLAAYRVYLNLTDMDTKESSSVLFAGKTVFFVNQTIISYDEKKLVNKGANTVYPDNSVCKTSSFSQKKYLYDENLNGKYDEGEQYIYSVDTDEEGCIVADVPEGYRAMLAL
ncbi:MAG: hypothetical protein QME12_06935 [Nanoarchaeota archaeon]|nr:hypothetical protein [Nanoarchaeota archaeon]